MESIDQTNANIQQVLYGLWAYDTTSYENYNYYHSPRGANVYEYDTSFYVYSNFGETFYVYKNAEDYVASYSVDGTPESHWENLFAKDDGREYNKKVAELFAHSLNL